MSALFDQLPAGGADYPHVTGLDLSMTSTGAAWVDGTTETIAPKVKGDARLIETVRRILACIPTVGSLVVIEDLPANAKSAGITGMMQGAVRHALLERDIPYVSVVPSTLKKYATGKGNAGKPEMAVAAYKRFEMEFGSDDDRCDAWWLRAAGLDALGRPLCVMPAAQRAALVVVNWPKPRLVA